MTRASSAMDSPNSCRRCSNLNATTRDVAVAVASANWPSPCRKASNDVPMCRFGLLTLNILLSTPRQVEIGLWHRLRFLDQSMQKDHLTLMRAKDHPCNSTLTEVCPDFPKPVLQGSNQRYPQRPAYLGRFDVPAYPQPILIR